jgi:hypothetical protein
VRVVEMSAAAEATAGATAKHAQSRSVLTVIPILEGVRAYSSGGILSSGLRTPAGATRWKTASRVGVQRLSLERADGGECCADVRSRSGLDLADEHPVLARSSLVAPSRFRVPVVTCPGVSGVGRGPGVPRLATLRRVPDRRRPGTFLDRRWQALRYLDAERYGVAGTPARRRDLDHPRVVERVPRRLEFRIGPRRRKLRGPDAVVVRGLRRVDGVADRRQAAVRVGLPVAAPDDFVDRVVLGAPGIDPPLTIWMRSRLPLPGSFIAATMNDGALPFAPLSSPPMGTPRG